MCTFWNNVETYVATKELKKNGFIVNSQNIK